MRSIIACVCFSVLLFHFKAVAQTTTTITDLRCEHLTSPLGIDAPHPRLSWVIQDGTTGAKQSAYQIFLGKDSTRLAGETAWHTVKVNSAAQLATFYGQLQPFTKYYWVVKLWDGEGKLSSSPVASFETGMMEQKNWKGDWIRDTRDIHLQAAPYFRRAFTIAKKIVSARAYIAAAGLYELYINGQRVGNHRLDPMFTRFDRRTLYITYDVTQQLQQGANAIGVLLGNGWYNLQSTAVWYIHEAPWRARPTFCLDVRITYSDGTVETVSSSKEWKTTLSPVMFNSIYTGEHYDARKEIPHWDEPVYNDSAWQQVIYAAAPSQHIVAQTLQPIRYVETVPATAINKFNDTDYVFNLGRNIAGISHITLNGPAGTVVRLKHGERLYTNGHVDISNIDVHYRPTDNTDPFQTDIYILNGNGPETFQPHFNYKGFQYVEVTSSAPILLSKESLYGSFMHSDVQPVGTVQSSNNTINKIWAAANNSYLSNFFGYPTDCPQREKNGWTGDAQIASETGMYNFDGITVYEKWMADHRDEQQPNGVLPSIIPTGGWGYEWGNGLDYTSTIAIIPWNLYLFYGDAKALSDCYDNIKRYVDHVNSLYPSGLTSWGLGDWIPVKSKSPVELTSTCYYFADVTILANAAKLFMKQDDYITYTQLAAKIKVAFNAKYFNVKKGVYGTGLQTEMAVPLMWGLVPEDVKPTVAANLAKRVLADSTSLDVGLLGTKAILNALSENGYAGLAYQLASKETFPSWGWWIVNGATTLYENWPINASSDISMNHIMFGEISAWMYKALGGIKPDPSAPGFKNTLLHPYFVNGLDSFSAVHQSPYGLIKSAWKRVDKQITYNITIPANASATLTIDVANGQVVYKNDVKQTITGNAFYATLSAGSFEFEVR